MRFLIILSLLLIGCNSVEEPKAPNIVFFIADDMYPDMFNCLPQGKGKNLTPNLEGAKVSYNKVSETPPLEKTPGSSKLLDQVRTIADGMGLHLEDGQTGGGSDASIAAGTGLPVIDGLGPDGLGIHAEDEHLLIPSFLQRTALLTELLSKL